MNRSSRDDNEHDTHLSRTTLVNDMAPNTSLHVGHPTCRCSKTIAPFQPYPCKQCVELKHSTLQLLATKVRQSTTFLSQDRPRISIIFKKENSTQFRSLPYLSNKLTVPPKIDPTTFKSTCIGSRTSQATHLLSIVYSSSISLNPSSKPLLVSQQYPVLPRLSLCHLTTLR